MQKIDNIVNGFLNESKIFSALSQEAIQKLVDWDNKEDKKEIKRPDWDDFFLVLAFNISQRSSDGRSKHGCVLVKDKTIISTGYNSFVRDIPDFLFPNFSHEKLPFMAHSETNALLNCARTGVSCLGATAYITGMPCISCIQQLYNAGISKIIHGNRQWNSKGENYEVYREILDWAMSGKMSIIQKNIDKEYVDKLIEVLEEACKE